MPTEILIKSNTAIVWADTTDYAGSGGTRTDQIDLTSVVDNAARQGAKADLGITRANRFALTLRIEWSVAPVSGVTVDLFFAPSINATAGTANPGGASGADAAYTGTAGDSLDDSLLQLDFVGALVCTSDALVQQQTFLYEPPSRWTSPVVVNRSGQSFIADAVEMSITATPIVDEIQN